MTTLRVGYHYDYGGYENIEFLLIARDVLGSVSFVFVVDADRGEHLLIEKDVWYSTEAQSIIKERG